ncbi:PDZ domain-containing protein [Clostridium niameyense]|uniref:PDZ domain-containing protein n=1 Tax=Clostridium niameyense TaxID=1622073 RepID=A0A6M0R8Z4_9CLOT|nr:PDZ domain-containing protein [Clostridium niameyense]NEZ46723.1 PDZ domain-containing protein [Clostridium niameyense]
MNILLHTLRTVAYALVEPYFAIILFLVALFLYRKNRRTCIMQKMIIGQKVNTPLELTISQIVMGIFGGVLASLIMSYLGIFFSEDSSIDLIFIVSLIFMFFNPRFICFSYSGAALGITSLIMSLLSKTLNLPVLDVLKIDIPSLMAMISILHFVEGILVMIDGNRGYIPVFTKRENKIIGGFAFQRYWILPIALFIMMNPETASNFLVLKQTMPRWWPILGTSFSKSILATAIITLLPFYGVVGYNGVTFTKARRQKVINSGLLIVFYSLLLFIFSQLAFRNIFFKVFVLIFAPIGHEGVIIIQKYLEAKGKPKYVSTEEGIMVLDVAKDSVANRMGIKSGDLLLEVNDKSINNEEDIVKSIEEMYGHITFKIKSGMGILKTVTHGRINSYDKLGIVFVPRAVPEQSTVIGVNDKKFKEILDKIKNKDKDE